MKKTFKIILFTVIFIILTYSILWFGALFSLSSFINKKYSNTDISVGESRQYFVKFSKVKPYGFPFKFGISVINWQEESINRKIDVVSPINIGYDLMKQDLFISFSGEAIGRFKPVERGFGVKFYSNDCILSVKMPLSFKILDIIKGKRDLFEIINFVENIKFASGKVEIFDLVDSKKLYEEDHTIFTLGFDKSKYYTSKQDFLNNIPQELEVNYDTEISLSDIEDRTIPAGLLLYRLAWHNNFKFSANFLVTTNSSNYKDLDKDLTIKITNAKISSDGFENNMNLLYQGKSDGSGNNNSHILIDSHFKINQGFIQNLLDTVKKYHDRLTSIASVGKIYNYDAADDDLLYVINNSQQLDFSLLENREYDFNLDINLATESYKLTRGQINNLSLYSKGSGFSLTNETIVNILKNSYSKGVIVANNYPKIIDVLGTYIYDFGKFKQLSVESKEVYKNGLSAFLKTISDHPNSSNSIDVSFEYEIDLSDINKAKIGTIDDINKIIPLYYVSLYRAAVKKVKIGEDPKQRIMELIPDFKEHKKILEECILPGFQEINENLWQEIIK